MSSPIENARKRLHEITVEAEEIRRFIKLYERFSDSETPAPTRSVAKAVNNSGENLFEEPNVVDSGDNLATGPRRGPRPRELAEMVERLIREVGRPMTRGEIIEALERRDVEIPAKDKSRYVGTIVWRNKGKFINIEGRGYWLRDVLQSVPGVPPMTTYSDPPHETAPELRDSPSCD